MANNFLQDQLDQRAKDLQDAGYVPLQEPIDWNQPMPMSPEDQQVFGAPQAGLPPDWNYQTSSTSPDGKPLPRGGKGWNPDGSVWYGGNSGISNWFLGLQSRLFADVNTGTSADAWADSLRLGSESQKALFTGNFSEYFNKGLSGLAKIGESLSKLGVGSETDASGKPIVKPTIATYISRAVTETVSGTVTAFSEVAQEVEQIRGAVANVSEDTTVFEEGTQQLAETIDSVDWIPDEGLLAVHKWFPSLLYSLNFPAFLFEAGQAVIAPGTLAEKTERLRQGYEAGRILYTTVLDPVVKEEYLRRFEAGENPYLLAEELQNPSAELAGQLAADPLNITGLFAKELRQFMRIGAAQDLLTRVAPELGTAFNKVDDISEAAQIGRITEMDDALRVGTKAVRDNIAKTVVDFGITAGTQASKRNYFSHISGEIFRGIAAALKEAHPNTWMDKAADTMRGLMMIHADDAATRAKGLAYLNGSGLPMDILLSKGSLQTGAMLNALDPKIVTQIVRDSAGDLGKLVTAFDKKLEAATETLIPSLDQLAKTGVDLGIRGTTFRTMNRVLESKVVGGINNALSFLYMGLSPGYAFRNMLSNVFHIFADLGVRAAFESPFNASGLLGKTEDWLGGVVGRSFSQGIGPSGGVPGVSEGRWWDMRRLSGRLESGASARIVYKTAKDTVTRGIATLIKSEAENLIKLGATQADIVTFERAMLNFKGNVDETMRFLRESQANGYVDISRNLEFLSQDSLKGLNQYELFDDFKLALQNLPEGATVDEAIAASKSIRDKADELARQFDAEPIHPKIDDTLDDLHAMSAGVHEGVVPDRINDLFQRQRSMNSRATDLITDAVENNTKLAQQAGVDVQSLLNQKPEFKALVQGDIMESAYRSGQQLTEVRSVILNGVKNGDSAAFKKAWLELGGKGNLPETALTDYRAFRNFVFTKYIFPDRARHWAKVRDAYAGLAKEYLEQLAKLGDNVFDQEAIDKGFIALGDAMTWDSAVIRNGKGYSVNPVTWAEEVANVTDDIPVGGKPLKNHAVDNGSTPSIAQGFSESSAGIGKMFDEIEAGLKTSWGTKRAVGKIDPVLDYLEKVARAEMPKVRLTAMEVSRVARNFALHDYADRKNFDLALGLIYPYQFWYSRTYANWLRRIATNSGTIAAYAKYKDFMAEIHAGLPEWWKYNINSDELLGIDTGNPLYFNLEQTINPLNGLTGVDYNDPYKRVNGISRLLDDMGKLGPSTWTPFAIANAIGLSMQGQDEAAARWAGRLIPFTATAETIATRVLGLDPYNLDPGIAIFSGGEDPHLADRTARALAAMVDEGLITNDQAIDAAAERGSNQIWKDAKTRAINERAPGQIASFLFGVGFKGRTASDITIDSFNQEMGVAMNLRDTLSPEEFSNRMEALRTKYEFMDALLIARKGSEQRDAALAWNVLNRLPPGGSSITEAAGIPEELLDKFYETKGDWSQWSETDRERFMAGVTDMRAILASPSVGTRQEWDAAKDTYKSMVANLVRQFGVRTQDKVERFFQLQAESSEAGQAYLAVNPEVEQWLDTQAQFIVSDRLLSAYYGGIEQITKYYTGVMYDKAEEKFGANISIIEDAYWQQNAMSVSDGRAYLRLHPELKAFWDFKEAYRANVLFPAVASLANHLPEGIPAGIRDDTEPQSLGQTGVLGAVEESQLPQSIDPQVVVDALGQTNLALVLDFVNYGAQLPEVTQRRISQIAQQAGLSEEDLLNLIRQSMR